MFPELFTIPGINWPIHSFGLMLVIGLLCAMELAKRLANRRGIDGEVYSTAGILALVFGVLGARLSHVLENLGEYTDPSRSFWANLSAAANLGAGGLTYYGGVLLSAPIIIGYLKWKKVPLLLSMDIAAPALMIGLAFGRIGCFLNGCCYGQVCELPWAVKFPYGSSAYVDQFVQQKLSPGPGLVSLTEDGRLMLLPKERALTNPLTRSAAIAARSLPVHPAQLYSSAMAFLIASICVAHLTLGKAPGKTFALMLILEGFARYLLESLRVEPAVLRAPVLGAMSYSMVVGLGISGLGVLLWAVFSRGKGARAEGAVAGVSAS